MVEFGDPPSPRYQPEEIDRPRGILSPRDRKYLLGEADIDPRSQAARNVRAAIRDRLENAILDCTLLFRHLEGRDRQKVFDELTGGRPPRNADHVMPPQGMIHAIALFYVASEHPDMDSFTPTLIEALRAVADQRGEFREIGAEITFEPEMDIDELDRQLEDDERTIRDIGQLYNDNRISLDSLLRLVGESQLSEALRGTEEKERGEQDG